MTPAGTREALIVAVSEYRDPSLRRLRAPAADAERLAAVLGDPEIGDFDVEVLRDPEERDLRRRLAKFFDPERRPDDLLMVHFSCHGVKDQSGELYLASIDTEKDLLDATGIDATWLNRRIGRCRSRRIVVLLDCCFSGSFPFGVHTRGGDEVNAQVHLEGRGRAVITASNAMEYAYEGNELTGHGQPSVFTDAVVEGLATGMADRDRDKLISIQELYEYVFDRVKQTQPAQTPKIMSTLEGPLHIARSSYEPPIEPARLDEQLLGLVEHPVPDARLGAVDALGRLLSSSDKGVALAARLALEPMVNDDSKRVAERAAAALARVSGEEHAGGGAVDHPVSSEESARPETDGESGAQPVDPGDIRASAEPVPSPPRPTATPSAARDVDRPQWTAPVRLTVGRAIPAGVVAGGLAGLLLLLLGGSTSDRWASEDSADFFSTPEGSSILTAAGLLAVFGATLVGALTILLRDFERPWQESLAPAGRAALIGAGCGAVSGAVGEGLLYLITRDAGNTPTHTPALICVLLAFLGVALAAGLAFQIRGWALGGVILGTLIATVPAFYVNGLMITVTDVGLSSEGANFAFNGVVAGALIGLGLVTGMLLTRRAWPAPTSAPPRARSW